jgi:cytidylate kinase
VIEAGIDPENGPAVAALLPQLGVACSLANGHSTVLINGRSPEEELHSPEVNEAVSAISRVPEVRERLLPLQRGFAGAANIVVEGRDIGSVVFPSTPFKFFIDASPAVRAKRRADQGLADSVSDRDSQDSQRAVAPLTRAEGAIVIDSSDLTISQVVARIIRELQAKGLVA